MINKGKGLGLIIGFTKIKDVNGFIMVIQWVNNWLIMSLGLHIGSFLLVENMIAPIFVAYIDMYSIYCVYVYIYIYIHMFRFGESPTMF